MDKKRYLIILCIITKFLVTGCTYIAPPQELIKRPRNTIGENKNFYIISRFLDENKILTLAEKQKEEEAIRWVDIDGDKTDEALVLYKNIDEKYGAFQGLGLLILKKKDGQWHKINEIRGGGTDFDLVDCVDITGDKQPEIIVGTDMEDEPNKKLVVYSYHNGYFHSIYNSNYRDMDIGDINADGQKEVIIFNKETGSGFKYVEILKYSGNDMIALDKYPIYSKSYYSKITVGRISKVDIGILIDHDVGAYRGYTDILIMRNNKLIQALREPMGENLQNLKGYSEGSEDIDKDGIIEIGFVSRLLKFNEDESYPSPYMKTWYQWNGKDDIVLTRREYYNYDLGYKIVLPKEWKESFTIIEKSDEKKIEFYSLDVKEKLDKRIFYIKAFDKEKWEKEELLLEEKYLVLKESKKSIIVGVIQNKDRQSTYYIDEERLKAIFNPDFS